MNTKLMLNAAAVLFTSSGLAFGATTINFDDLAAGVSGSGDYPAPASGYGGLNWDNFLGVDGADSTGSGYQFAAVSPKNAVFNGGGNAATITGSPFDLTSAYFTAAWNNNLQLEVQGYVGATLTYDQTYSLSTTSPSLITFDFAGVDQVNFITSGGTPNPNFAPNGNGTQFAMDDLTINGNNPNGGTVPDAGSTSILLGAAITGLGLLRRKLA